MGPARKQVRTVDQLELPLAGGVEAALEWPDRARQTALRARIPAHIHFGTSDWHEASWRDLVYQPHRTQVELEREGLVEYGAHPLLTTLAFEPRGERLPDLADLRRLASQLPQQMPVVGILPRLLTTPRFVRAQAGGAAHGAPGQAGRFNPQFLDLAYLVREVIPHYRRGLGSHLSALVLSFPPVLAQAGIAPEALVERLDNFLAALPPEIPWAIELAEPRYLTLAYAKVLAAHDVSHVHTTWPGMPSLVDQARRVATPAVRIVRWVGEKHAETRGPATHLARVDPGLRAETVELVRAEPPRPTFVLVTDAVEGSAPLSIAGLAEALAL